MMLVIDASAEVVAVEPAQPQRTVNKARGADVVNRLSDQQRDTLEIIRRLGKPKVGELIRALRGGELNRRDGHAAYATAYASMSRTLTRLHRRGLVEFWQPAICTQGMGGWWSITPKGLKALVEGVS